MKQFNYINMWFLLNNIKGINRILALEHLQGLALIMPQLQQQWFIIDLIVLNELDCTELLRRVQFLHVVALVHGAEAALSQ
jgi:hypothetical protein